jgi:hypothetical protein
MIVRSFAGCQLRYTSKPINRNLLCASAEELVGDDIPRVQPRLAQHLVSTNSLHFLKLHSGATLSSLHSQYHLDAALVSRQRCDLKASSELQDRCRTLLGSAPFPPPSRSGWAPPDPLTIDHEDGRRFLFIMVLAVRQEGAQE